MPGSRLSNLLQPVLGAERGLLALQRRDVYKIQSEGSREKNILCRSVFRPNLPALVPREFISSEIPLQLLLPSGQAFPGEWPKQVALFSPAGVCEVYTNPSDDCQKEGSSRKASSLRYASPRRRQGYKASEAVRGKLDHLSQNMFKFLIIIRLIGRLSPMLFDG